VTVWRCTATVTTAWFACSPTFGSTHDPSLARLPSTTNLASPLRAQCSAEMPHASSSQPRRTHAASEPSHPTSGTPNESRQGCPSSFIPPAAKSGAGIGIVWRGSPHRRANANLEPHPSHQCFLDEEKVLASLSRCRCAFRCPWLFVLTPACYPRIQCLKLQPRFASL
jgi:hypothetical protein